MASIFAWQRRESAAIVARPQAGVDDAAALHQREAGQAGADACECAQEHAERALPDVALVVGRQPSLEMKGRIKLTIRDPPPIMSRIRAGGPCRRQPLILARRP
ncbi:MULTISPECIES: hypothetical protein [Burkholderia]|uniref:hypothetical protein n=1 Tax=Burkholderia TaxID=32008 RepID=UPI00158A0E02|nr:hypothetical protein [Burkholderia ambifaria]